MSRKKYRYNSRQETVLPLKCYQCLQYPSLSTLENMNCATSFQFSQSFLAIYGESKIYNCKALFFTGWLNNSLGLRKRRHVGLLLKEFPLLVAKHRRLESIFSIHCLFVGVYFFSLTLSASDFQT